MTTQGISLRFTLRHWCLWQSEDIKATNAPPAGKLLPSDHGNARVDFLPMMQRRRLSPLARAAVSVVWQCRQECGDMPRVFYSQHGETQLYYTMLQTMADNGEVSPSRFSTSVHNAIAGLSSFYGNSPLPYVTLAGGTEGVFAAFLEAAGMLLETPQLALICYGQPLPEAYRPYVSSPTLKWALGLVLATDNMPGMKLQLRCAAANNAPLDDDDGYTLARSFLDGAHGSNSRWQWGLAHV